MSLSNDVLFPNKGSHMHEVPIMLPRAKAFWRHFMADTLLPLRTPDFRLLFCGQTLSTLGDMFYTLTLPWLVLANGKSALELGFVLCAYGLPRIGTLLLGGILSDRFHPRRLMLVADIMRMVTVAMLAMLVLHGAFMLWPLSVVAALLGAWGGIFLPASYALMPVLLGKDDLQAGNALYASSTQLAALLGAAVASFLIVHVQASTALLIDALSFGVSAATLLLMKGENPSAKLMANEASNEERSTIWRLLSHCRLLRLSLLIVVISNLAAGGMIEVGLPTLAHSQLATGISGYGVMLTAFGAGVCGGAALAGGMGQWPRRGILTLVCLLLQAIGFAMIPLVGDLSATALILLATGLMNGVLNVFFITLVQQHYPGYLLGSIMGIFMVAIYSSYPLSVVIAGMVMVHFGPVPLFFTGAAAMLCASLFGLFQRPLTVL